MKMVNPDVVAAAQQFDQTYKELHKDTYEKQKAIHYQNKVERPWKIPWPNDCANPLTEEEAFHFGEGVKEVENGEGYACQEDTIDDDYEHIVTYN